MAAVDECELQTSDCYRHWVLEATTENVYGSAAQAGSFNVKEIHQFNLHINRRRKVLGRSDYLFRHLSGSDLRSPRCRYDGRNCLALRYVLPDDTGDRRGWYIIRTACAAGPRERRFFRFYIIQDFMNACPAASFDWVLRDPATAGHFRSYASADDECAHGAASGRFMMIVGPATSRDYPDQPFPTSCLVDLRQKTMEVFDFRQLETHTWPTIVAFDPRESRDHVFAAVCTQRSSDCLPKDVGDDVTAGTTSVCLVDVHSRRVIHSIASISNCSFQPGRLQFVNHGNQLLTVVSSPVHSGHLPTSCNNLLLSFILLSTDNLSPLFRLPLSNAHHQALACSSSRFEWFLLLSVDNSRLVLVWNDRHSDVIRDTRHVCGPQDSSSTSCLTSGFVDRNNNISAFPSNSIPSEIFCPVVSTVYRVPLRTALPLLRLCADVILKLANDRSRIDGLPVPGLLRTALIGSGQAAVFHQSSSWLQSFV